jgi:hypothetical protein
MYSFRRLALVLALGLPAMTVVLAQNPSSTTDPAATTKQDQQAAPVQTEQQMSVQARIKARRAQRRAAAIHDTYAHSFELYANMNYLRFTPGPSAQRATMYGWDTGFTRFYSDRLGISLDGRGYYGTAYVGPNFSSITRPAISTYSVMIGPTYRFYMQPKYSISGRVLGGFAAGNFTGDTNGFGSICASSNSCLLYQDGSTFAASAGVVGEYNMTPNMAIRLASDYYVTGFGSSVQGDFGFNTGIVYRFGKK